MNILTVSKSWKCPKYDDPYSGHLIYSGYTFMVQTLPYEQWLLRIYKIISNNNIRNYRKITLDKVESKRMPNRGLEKKYKEVSTVAG